MKKLLTLSATLSALVAVTALANECPNLSGTYSDGDVNVAISQAVEKGVTVYSLEVESDGEKTKEVFITDGQQRQSNSLSPIAFSYQCKAGQLIQEGLLESTEDYRSPNGISVSSDDNSGYMREYIRLANIAIAKKGILKTTLRTKTEHSKLESGDLMSITEVQTSFDVVGTAEHGEVRDTNKEILKRVK